MMEVERALRMLDGAVSLIVSCHFLLTERSAFEPPSFLVYKSRLV
jgi:hypothetical protein